MRILFLIAFSSLYSTFANAEVLTISGYGSQYDISCSSEGQITLLAEENMKENAKIACGQFGIGPKEVPGSRSTRSIKRMHDAYAASGVRDLLSVELRAGKSGPDTRMLGSGMTLINPPFTLADEMRTLLPWFNDVLHQGPGSGWDVTKLIGE